eukprot:s1217_g4.t1
MQVGLVLVEKIFLEHAQLLEEDWSEYHLSKMEELIDKYCDICEHFQSSAQWKVELRSREVLVVWIGFCLAMRAAELEHGLVRDYGPSLRPEHLQRLLLSKAEEIDALKAVDRFLKSRNRGLGLFNLSDQEPTFQFASKFGAQSLELQDILKIERDAEEIRMAKHWDQVQKQQEEAKKLRKVIANLQQELDLKKPQLAQVRSVEQQRQSARNNVEKIRRELEQLDTSNIEQLDSNSWTWFESKHSLERQRDLESRRDEWH